MKFTQEERTWITALGIVIVLLLLIPFLAGCTITRTRPMTLEDQLRECRREEIINRHFNQGMFNHYLIQKRSRR